MKFDEKGDGPARYTILNYQKNPESNGYDYKVSHSAGAKCQVQGEPVVTKKIQTGLQTNMEKSR